MIDLLLRYATPLITGLFMISLISGLMLYFHLYGGYVRGMHEILSLVLVAPFVLHLWRNWRAFLGYFSRPPFVASMVVCALAAGYFVVTAPPQRPRERGGLPPQFALAHKLMGLPAEKVALLIGKTPEQLVEQMKKSGFEAAVLGVSLGEIASKAGRDEGAMITLLAGP